ncbi:hypothetical protein TRICI_000668 [Trichomonascus ciferrii]|uniref:Uncharacterized protein n=1 Tax=Trichomonascus ciferrii TaxID=44093 RepID=A0A642VBD5_9ASCO|nr:hypothetical protein TRICI_000668 [Trichomonascus ciferrii]
MHPFLVRLDPSNPNYESIKQIVEQKGGLMYKPDQDVVARAIMDPDVAEQIESIAGIHPQGSLRSSGPRGSGGVPPEANPTSEKAKFSLQVNQSSIREADPRGLGACPQKPIGHVRSEIVTPALQNMAHYPKLREADPGGLGACPQKLTPQARNRSVCKLTNRSGPRRSGARSQSDGIGGKGVISWLAGGMKHVVVD